MKRGCTFSTTFRYLRSASVSYTGSGEPLRLIAPTIFGIPVLRAPAIPSSLRKSPRRLFLSPLDLISSLEMSSSEIPLSNPGKLRTSNEPGVTVTTTGSPIW